MEEDYLKATELRLGLPGNGGAAAPEIEPVPAAHAKCSKRERPEPGDEQSLVLEEDVADQQPAAKAQIVGWPPVRAYRMNSFNTRKKASAPAPASVPAAAADGNGSSGVFVKVSMDGAPYLRKIDLKGYQCYRELRAALEDMFKCSSLGGAEGYGESEYAITYEDKDGDWMLVGDVPWGMFISLCKRMRIMKGWEARGLSTTNAQ